MKTPDNLRMLKYLSLLLLFVHATAQAATYYVSPTGSDTNNGTSQTTPWRTITRVNQVTLVAGDKVLFQRGGEYRGKLTINHSGNANAYIEVGAYGTGEKPIISGSVAVTGWTIHSGNIWKAPLAQVPKYLYAGGQMQTVARFPNTGFLYMDGGTSTSLTDADLNQASGYWTGATAVIRTTNWGYDTAYVTGFTGSTLTHTATGNNIQNQQWGYFLTNKLALLDAPGEWYYDRPTGMLYVWCPGNANPNTMVVEASVLDNGVYVAYQRHHIKVDGLHMRHHTAASLRLAGSYSLEAMNCTMSDTYQAIYSTGNNQSFHHLTIARTYGSGVYLLDSNSSFTFSTLTDVAVYPGLGEQNIGYIGIRMSGSGGVVADNRLERIGWSGIAVTANALVERNIVISSMHILNDGAGITLDSSDGVIIRDNIVRDLVGDLTSCAIGHYNSIPQCHGIYFGNVSNKNVQITRNTVMNCNGSGIHVDHTMVLTGVRVENNVMFNNIRQLSISDYSNYNGPGATQPYFVPSFNTVYSGNVMYCLTKDQLCIQQLHVYGTQWVDFGTFTNNRYFNPYNDRSIYMHRFANGFHRWMALERWQSEFGEDAGSTRSPLYLPSMETTAVLSTLAVPNGSFSSNVTGWTGWPSQGVLAHNTSRLDNGCMRVTFTNNASSNNFTLYPTSTVPVQQGSLYRMRFSLVGDAQGELNFSFQGNSQLGTNNSEGSRVFPYDGTRRDVEHYFTSNITEQGMPRLNHVYTDGVYYIDNISLERVTAVPVDPYQNSRILLNELATAQTFTLPSGCWKDTDGSVMGGTLTLQPYQSRVIYRYSTAGNCASQVDCAGVAGGPAVPGTSCNDNNPCTVNDTWNASCQCVGTASGLTAGITASGSTSLCTGGSVVLNATAGTGYTYQWRNNGANISGATAAAYTATAAGSYTVVVTTSGGCAATSAATAVTVSSAPAATITAGGSTTICSGGSVALSANTGTGLTYQWRNNGTNISGATSATYTATAAGSYTVVVSSGGCGTTSAATVVSVNPSPTASITAGGATGFCTGGSVVLSAATGTGYTYQWRNNGTNISGATAASYTASAAGSYTVVVTSGGCTSTSAATTVTVGAAPAATITAGGSTTFCSGSSVVLSANTGTGFTYQWRNGGTNISGATASTYTATAAGSYTVVVSNGGCTTTSAATTVTVSAAPTATIAAGGATSFCTGGSVVLSATTGTGYTYQWRNNGTSISGATSSTYTATAAGSYTVLVTAGGCSATSSATTVTVNSVPTATITAGGVTSFCAGGSVVLSANSGTGLTYQWRRDGANISGATASSYTATLGGSYTVIVASGGCSSTSTATTVTLKAAPVVNCSASASTSTVSVTATGGQSPYTYSWSTTPVQTSATATVSASGTYTATVTGANGCASSCSATITLSGSSTASCTGLRTEAQGTWGMNPTQWNIAGFMASNWSAAFPTSDGLTIGCGTRLMRFTSAAAVNTTLPTYGTPALLATGTTVNPPASINNTLVGQIVSLALNIRFDELSPTFAPSNLALKDMVVASGTFAGFTVQQLLNLANQHVGGCASSYPLATISTALTNLNNGYQGATMNNGYLLCPGLAAMPLEGEADWLGGAEGIEATAYPNPFRGTTTIALRGLDPKERLMVRVIDLAGAEVARLFEGTAPEDGQRQFLFEANQLAAGMYLYEVVNGERAVRGKLMAE